MTGEREEKDQSASPLQVRCSAMAALPCVPVRARVRALTDGRGAAA